MLCGVPYKPETIPAWKHENNLTFPAVWIEERKQLFLNTNCLDAKGNCIITELAQGFWKNLVVLCYFL
jgi:hypothetical protein